MFFKVFLLTIFFSNVSSTFIAEQEYYKHNTDDYDDYEYDDAISDEVVKTNDGTNTSKATFEKTSKETNQFTEKNPTTQTLIKEYEKEGSLGPVIPKNNKSTSSIDNDDDITYILTDKPEVDNNLPSYEVTEDVDDIPNTVTFKPIVTNFTIKLPLNNATGVNISNENNSGENKRGTNLRKNSISIFHVSAEFDDKETKPVVQNINIHKIPFGIFKVKDHVDKLKDDVLNYVHSTEIYEETDHGYLPNILSAPKIFFNKLREKGSALFHKFHFV